ncbi:MAG: hypothetical protein K6A71_12745 [Lachnospiraceae bacterium]|nr:hypothetical protein [Lachnospiraceae bacterium]
MEETREYDDIINLKRPESGRHPRMPVENRAAQFSPFAALTGFDSAIDNTARETTESIIASELGYTFEEAP